MIKVKQLLAILYLKQYIDFYNEFNSRMDKIRFYRRLESFKKKYKTIRTDEVWNLKTFWRKNDFTSDSDQKFRRVIQETLLCII